MTRAHYFLGWGFVTVCVGMLLMAQPPIPDVDLKHPDPAPSPSFDRDIADASEWWRRVRPYCNVVEAKTMLSQSPPPMTIPGAGYHAACFALAGQIDEARRVIDGVAPKDRFRAAGIVFEVGHPVADAGDDRSAAPIMELVIDYWPNHYMALYHAGMAEYMLGQHYLAKRNLERFLQMYFENDGWRANARAVLKRIDDGSKDDLRRPAEPR